MQKKTKKIFDIIAILIDLVMLTFMILSITLKKNTVYAWYWIIVSIMLVFEVFYIHKWDKVDELNVDKHQSRTIRRTFDGITVGTVCISGALYLLVMGLEFLDKSIKNNIFVILIVGIMLTLSLLFNFLAVYTANKETKELAEKMFNYKK